MPLPKRRRRVVTEPYVEGLRYKPSKRVKAAGFARGPLKQFARNNLPKSLVVDWLNNKKAAR
jgi:hypothetical protein